MLRFKALKKEIITALEYLIDNEGAVTVVVIDWDSQKVVSEGPDVKKLLEQIKKKNNNIRDPELLYRMDCLLTYLQIKIKEKYHA